MLGQNGWPNLAKYLDSRIDTCSFDPPADASPCDATVPIQLRGTDGSYLRPGGRKHDVPA